MPNNYEYQRLREIEDIKNQSKEIAKLNKELQRQNEAILKELQQERLFNSLTPQERLEYQEEQARLREEARKREQLEREEEEKRLKKKLKEIEEWFEPFEAKRPGIRDEWEKAQSRAQDEYKPRRRKAWIKLAAAIWGIFQILPLMAELIILSFEFMFFPHSSSGIILFSIFFIIIVSAIGIWLISLLIKVIKESVSTLKKPKPSYKSIPDSEEELWEMINTYSK